MTEHVEDIGKYNLWDGTNIHNGIPRPAYTDQIYRYCNDGIVKVLTGQRRVGKSYILRQLACRLIESGVAPTHILIINKEYAAFNFIANGDDLHQFITAYKRHFNIKGRYYLLIDEVQEINAWEKTVNSYSQDYTEKVDLFITGSNSKLLSSELSTKIAGRYIKFQIYPLSFREYLSFYSGEKDRNHYLSYMKTGGLPALCNLPDDEMKTNYVDALRDTIILKDIVAHYNVKDIQLLENLFAYLVSNASNLVSIPNIVNYIKSKGGNANYLTVSAYINHLMEAYLIHRVERYNVKGKEIISGLYKYYANDLAYKNYLYPHYESGLGYMLENLVYLDLIRAGFQARVGTLKNKEIDFIAEKGGLEIYIQVTYSLEDENTRRRECAPLLQLLPAHEKWIVSLDDFTPVLPAGIKSIPAWRLQDVLDAFAPSISAACSII